jgi:hypothetical protein
MKIKTKLLMILASLLTVTGLVSCDDAVIAADELPVVAQGFLKEYFPENEILSVKKDRELSKTFYEVVLQDGTEIEFDADGEWDSVDCIRSAVPAALIPGAIAEYVQINFPSQVIVKIDRETYGYEIELSSGLELRFDKNGKFLRVDD